ncbi:MAG: hypothetical protein ABIO70_27995 [Pseudomonadota bacterium]
MDISLFGRGIHLERVKTPAQIQELPTPARIRLALRQVAGHPCHPIVQKGDAVAEGQLVGEGPAPIHSPVSGVVKGVEEIPGLDGDKLSVLVIEADDTGRIAPFEADGVPLRRSAEELLDRIRAAGIVQPGRESLPLATMIEEALAPRGQIAPTGKAVQRPLRHLVVRCLDVDPGLAGLAALACTLQEDASDLALAIDALLKVTGAEQVHLALGTGQAPAALLALAADRDWAVQRMDEGQFPAAHDTLLAAAVSGQEPDVAWRRVDQSGTLVLDLDVVLQVTEAVRAGRPVLQRLVTVARGGQAKVLRVAIGAPMESLARAAGHNGVYGKVILGGPMQGLAYHGLDFPLGKCLQGLTLQEAAEVVHDLNHPCISCGLCAMVCPMRLTPGLLSRYCEFQRWEEAESAHLFTCIECGCCAFVCPAQRSMVQFMVQGKSEVLATRRAG